MNWPRTIGFGAIQITAGFFIQIWCLFIHGLFRYLHPHGRGAPLANFFWDYPWAYYAIACVLFGLVILGHRQKRGTLYESTIYFGYWLLVTWTGFAVVAMVPVFVPIVHTWGYSW